MSTTTREYSLTFHGNPLGRGRPKSDFAPSEIDALTDEQLSKYFISEPHPSLSQTEDICGATHALQLPDYPSIIIKRGTPIKPIQGRGENNDPAYSYPSEAYALQLIFEYTTIPVPRLRRVLKDPSRQSEGGGSGGSLIFMDSIPGRQLRDVWPTMTREEKVKVIFTVRSYVLQMRSIGMYYRHPRSKIPGPLAAGDIAEKGYSPVFGPGERYRGPFKDGKEFYAFMDERISKAINVDAGYPTERKKSSGGDSFPLVFTHQDLLINMRNVLVGDDGRLYLIDWTHAGFYPPYFEFACARILHSIVTDQVYVDGKTVTKEGSGSDSDSESGRDEFGLWDMMIPFICGPYYKEERWLKEAGMGFECR